MWRLVLTVVLWHTITSQPVTDDQNSRQPRQLDFVECCPCPGSSRAGLQDVGAAATSNGFSGAAAVDDCPCRLRDPDSQGSSSLFLPRAVRPVRPIVTPETPKEDIKPLLKPEVGLASSMLETLREVTDEEYREALARDAARNAARVAELGDAQPGTAKNVVTIIVNPRHDDVRDATPEASQPFETRCAPSGNLGRVIQAEKPSVFKFGQNLRSSLLDMDSGASEVKQSVVGLNRGLEGLRLKTTPSLLRLLPPRKSETNIQSLLKLKNNKQSNDQDVTTNLDSGKPKIPKRKLGSIFRKIGEEERTIKPLNPLGLGITKLKIPKLKTTLARKPKTNQFENDDNNQSPSIIHEKFTVPAEKKYTPFGLKSLLPPTPFNLKNFLNLKDVELIPPKSPKITLPDLQLFPHLRINKPGTKFVKQRKNERLAKQCDISEKDNERDTGIPKNQGIHTEILDAIPQASETNPVIADNSIQATTGAASNTNVVSKQGNVKTDILDALPSASETNEFVVENGNHIETSTPRLEDEITNSDGDLEAQKFEEIVTEPPNKHSKGNVENVDANENSIEISIENNENDDFHEFEIVQETDQPVSEINLSNSALDSLNLEIDEDDVSGASFSADDGEPIIIEELNGGEFESEAQEFIESEYNPELELNPEEETEEIETLETEPVLQPDEDILLRPDSSADIFNQNNQLPLLQLTEERTNAPTGRLGSAELTLKNVEPSHKSDLLSSLKERISIKLNSLKNPDTKIITISTLSKPAFEKTSFNSEESSDVEPLREDTEKFIINEKSAEMSTSETNQMEMQDLQHMSDSLLIKSERKINSELCGNSEGKATLGDSNLNTDSFMGVETLSANNIKEEVNSDMDSSATSFKETLDANHENDSGIDETLIEDIIARPDVGDLGDTKSNKNDRIDNTCSSNLQLAESVTNRKNEKSFLNLRNNGETEMESGASETVFNTARMPGSPLLHQSIVVQPTSLFPPIPNLDLSNVNLPTLDDIREGISNLFRENSRASEDASTNFDSDECVDSNPVMSSDASSTNIKSAFPTLEDINLDIFQINPQSLGSTLYKIPSLNLNSFRTKLALPKSLELKPLKLQSALGGKHGGLLGASLTFGPDKTTLSRKAKPVPNLGSILNLQGSEILRSPLPNMPSLDDLRETMRANAGSLLKSSITSPLEDTLKTTEAFSNSLRSHTENTMRNIQQSLSSTLNEARVSKAGGKFAKPQDLLEMVSLAHEDVKDKLYGIHVDLQDRLSSIHDSILDQTNLPIPTLQTPLLTGLGRLQDSPFSSFRTSNDFKKTPSPKLIVKKRKPTTKSNKPLSKPKEQHKVRPFKISKAASSLTPKSVQVPKLMATSIKPQFLRPLQRDKNVILQDTKPLFNNDEIKITDRKPFGLQSKVTIGTTPRTASIRTRPTPELGPKSASATRLITQRKGPFKSFSDSRGFASELQPKKVPAPFKPISSAKFLELNSAESREVSQGKPSSFLPSKLPDFAVRNPLFPRTSPTLKSIASIKFPSLKPTITPLTLPKSTESPIVSKMKDAIRIRFSRPESSTNSKLRNEVVSKPHGKEIMTSSASETKGVAVRAEPMKENVSYKCKMVCVRE